MIKKLKSKILKHWEITAAGILILAGVTILSGTYGPLIKDEIKYQFSNKGRNTVVVGKNQEAEKVAVEKAGLEVIQPVDESFGIVIPKISANAKVFAEVDPNDSAVYQRVLTKGVAQAKGSAYPGEKGNVFIFAHSGADISEALHYNAVFYLLGNLNPNDDIFLFRAGQRFHYVVKESKIVSPKDVQYLEKGDGSETVTLMTCWPAGTTFKRRIIIAERAS